MSGKIISLAGTIGCVFCVLTASYAVAQGNKVEQAHGGWSVSISENHNNSGRSRCVLRSPDVEGSQFWLSNNGTPRLEPSGAAAIGVIVKDTLEILVGQKYPEKLENALIIAPKHEYWEVSGIWTPGRRAGGTAQFQMNLPIGNVLSAMEAAGELIVVLPLPEPEIRFSFEEAGAQILKYRDCLNPP